MRHLAQQRSVRRLHRLQRTGLLTGVLTVIVNSGAAFAQQTTEGGGAAGGGAAGGPSWIVEALIVGAMVGLALFAVCRSSNRN